MSDRRVRLGRTGEHIAEEYLIAEGYEILHRRYRAARKEIDLIARLGRTIVFVEVKTDTSGSFGPPESWVTPRKQQAIIRAAGAYIASHASGTDDYRFDVIGVTLSGRKSEVQHIPGAFTVGC